MSERKYTLLIDRGAGTGRIVDLEKGNFKKQWGEQFIDLIEADDGVYDVPRYTKEEAEKILERYFPVRYVVTHNVGEGAFYIHRVTQGNWKSAMFLHETYCADFEKREDAELYVAERRA